MSRSLSSKKAAWLRNLPGDHGHVRHELQAAQVQVDRELVQGPSALKVIRELSWRGSRNRLEIDMVLML